jgi:hypothetical protein
MKSKNQEKEPIFEKFLNLLVDLESYQTPYAKVIGDPSLIYLPLIRKKSLLASALSFGASLPTGGWGLLTPFPEIYFLFQIQSRMVKDIAAIYGKERILTKDILLYCLFKKNHPNILERSIRFVGNRILLRPLTYSSLLEVLTLLNKVEVEPKWKKYANRSLHLVNAIACGGIAYTDTRIVGLTATQIFSKEIVFESEI